MEQYWVMYDDISLSMSNCYNTASVWLANANIRRQYLPYHCIIIAVSKVIISCQVIMMHKEVTKRQIHINNLGNSDSKVL